jgi:hypothetical protein
LLVIHAFLLGALLKSLGVTVPQWGTWGLGLGFMLAFWLYPAPGQPLGAWPFSRFLAQKTAHVVLLLTYAGVIAGSYNACRWASQAVPVPPAASPGLVFKLVARQIETAKRPAISQPEHRLPRDQAGLRSWLKLPWRDKKPLSPGGKVILVTLVVLGVIGLVVLISGLACHLACTGYEGLAWVVAGLGIVGALFLGFVLIRAINRRPRRSKAAASPLSQSNDSRG